MSSKTNVISSSHYKDVIAIVSSDSTEAGIFGSTLNGWLQNLLAIAEGLVSAAIPAPVRPQ
jgi:hypothetical protein